MRVVSDVLDKPLIDRQGRPLGRADGVELEVQDNEAPKIAAVLVGAVALGQRVSPRAGRWVAAVERLLRIRTESVRIAPARISLTDDGRLQVDLSAGETGADLVERALRRWVVRIPGAQR